MLKILDHYHTVSSVVEGMKIPREGTHCAEEDCSVAGVDVSWGYAD
jgi:hypothetical protein